MTLCDNMQSSGKRPQFNTVREMEGCGAKVLTELQSVFAPGKQGVRDGPHTGPAQYIGVPLVILAIGSVAGHRLDEHDAHSISHVSREVFIQVVRRKSTSSDLVRREFVDEHQVQVGSGSSTVGKPAQEKSIVVAGVIKSVLEKIATSSHMIDGCLSVSALLETAPVTDSREHEEAEGEVDGEHEARAQEVRCQCLKHTLVLLK